MIMSVELIMDLANSANKCRPSKYIQRETIVICKKLTSLFSQTTTKSFLQNGDFNLRENRTASLIYWTKTYLRVYIVVTLCILDSFSKFMIGEYKLRINELQNRDQLSQKIKLEHRSRFVFVSFAHKTKKPW